MDGSKVASPSYAVPWLFLWPTMFRNTSLETNNSNLYNGDIFYKGVNSCTLQRQPTLSNMVIVLSCGGAAPISLRSRAGYGLADGDARARTLFGSQAAYLCVQT
eukprot:2803666-Pleurochrysis_carterae.AAC.1